LSRIFPVAYLGPTGGGVSIEAAGSARNLAAGTIEATFEHRLLIGNQYFYSSIN
jgi:hypothetical protein